MSLNPALPVLALLGGAGLLWGLTGGTARALRRGLGIAWAVLAVAGIAFLSPALVLPTGIPSPAAELAGLPPWQAAEAPHLSGSPAGNPLLRDVTFQIQPWLLFLRHELRAGRLPFWNPWQFSGSPFWANGQSAPLFPLHLLFVVLPLQLGFVLLPWLRLVIGGCGAWALGRELGLSPPAALLAAITFPLSGMLVSFLLFPMGNALALVPWVLWAVERIAAGSGTWRPLAAAAGLQLLAGHPETAAHTALLTALYLLVRGAAAPLKAWLRFVAGWGIAGAIAAVQLLPLALTLLETSRWHHLAEAVHPPLPLLLQQPLRLVLPQLYGHPALGTWWGPFNYSATAVYAGALALPLAAAGLARCRGDRRWLAVAVLLAFSFAAAYHWPGIRELLGAMPVLGRALHHRLIFGVEIGLALLAGAGCDRWLEGKGRGLLAGAVATGLLLATAWLLYAGEWAPRGLSAGQAAWTAGVAGVSLLLVLSLRLTRERRWAVWPLLPALALCDLWLAHGAINPGVPRERLYPETGAVRFLRDQPGRVAGLGAALRPNAAMVYGLRDVRGDDPVKLERYEAVYRTFAPSDPVYYQPVERWGEPWLDRLGVRWVLAGPSQPPAAADAATDWGVSYVDKDGRVYERPGALPLVRWSGTSGELEVARQDPGVWEIDWRAPRSGLLVVAETWDRGWSAEVAGGPVPVLPVDGVLLGVRLGPGAGRLTLRYRPPGIAAGAALSLGGLMLLMGSWGVARRRSPSPPGPLSHPLPPAGGGGEDRGGQEAPLSRWKGGDGRGDGGEGS